MAMCRSGLLLPLNAKPGNCVARKPKIARAIGEVCLFLGAIPGRENARNNATVFPKVIGPMINRRVEDEDMDPDRIRIIKLHKRWADGLTLLWQMFVILLFGGIYIAMEQFGVDAAERSAAFILLGVMVLVAAIWQSTGLGVARVHMLLNGIDLGQPLKERGSNAGGAEK